MISAELLEILRCPMDPKRLTRLGDEGERLVCPSCGLKYPIKDGFPVMIVEEAELPAGCDSLERLRDKHKDEAASAVPQ
jgi:uncharacterized protein YbaR (Trm112 family)